MDINYEEIKSLESNLVNRILYFAISNEYTKEMERAKRIFTKTFKGQKDFIDEKGFLSWLLWDFKLKNNNNFFEEYKQVHRHKISQEEIEFIDSIKDSYLSVYEVVNCEDTIKLKDIFIKNEIDIENIFESSQDHLKSLLVARVFTYMGKNYITEDYITIDKIFKSTVEKNFYEKYEQYKDVNSFSNMKDFIKDNSLLIHKFVNIIDDLIKEQNEDDEEYMVWQSTYVVKDYYKVLEIINDNNDFELDYEENDTYYFRLFDDNGIILSEIVLNRNKMEVESVNDIDKNKAKNIIENLLGKYVYHYRDEIIYLEDII